MLYFFINIFFERRIWLLLLHHSRQNPPFPHYSTIETTFSLFSHSLYLGPQFQQPTSIACHRRSDRWIVAIFGYVIVWCLVVLTQLESPRSEVVWPFKCIFSYQSTKLFSGCRISVLALIDICRPRLPLDLISMSNMWFLVRFGA